MRNKAIQKMSAVLASVMLALGAFSVSACAEELPIAIATPDKATVSEETDKATNKDPDMGTQFYMYIPPDVVANDYPQMGDEGVSTQLLMACAIMSGVAYLGMTAYAHGGKQEAIA